MRRWARNPLDKYEQDFTMRYLQLEKTIEVLQGSPGFDEDRAEAARNYLLAAYADKKELPALGVLKLRLREDVGRKKGLEYAAEAGRDFVAQHGRPPKDDFELVAYMADHSKDSIREWRQHSSPEVQGGRACTAQGGSGAEAADAHPRGLRGGEGDRGGGEAGGAGGRTAHVGVG